MPDAPEFIAAQIAAAATAAGLPPEAVDAATRQIAHYVSGGEPDLEDVVWATEALKAAAPHIAAAERARILPLILAEIHRRRGLSGDSVYHLGKLAEELPGLIGPMP